MNLHSSREDQAAATSITARGGCVKGRGKHQTSGACASQSHRLEAALDGSRESLEQAVQIGRRSRGRWCGSACASRGLRAHPKLHAWCSPLPLAPESSPDAPPAAQHPPAPNPCLCGSSSLSPSPQADSAPPPLRASRPLPGTPALSPPWPFVSPQISLSIKAESGEPDPTLPRIHGAAPFLMPLLGWDGDFQPGKWYRAWRGSPRGAASCGPGSRRGRLAAAWGSLWPPCVPHACFLWIRATVEVLVGRIQQQTSQYRVPRSPFPPCVHSTPLGFQCPFIYLMPQCNRLSPPLTDASTGRA